MRIAAWLLGLFVLLVLLRVLATGPDSLLAAPCDDMQQWQADAFRAGQLNLPLDGEHVAAYDVAIVGDKLYQVWGLVPPAIFAALDSLTLWLYGGLFPKTLLFLLAAAMHVLGVGLLIRELSGGDLRTAVAWSAFYALTFPFVSMAALMLPIGENTSAVFGAAFFTLGAWRAVRYVRAPSLRDAIWGGVLLGLALLTRQLYLVHAFFLVAVALVAHRSRRDVWVLAGLAAGAVALLGALNAYRFGSPFETGDQRLALDEWEHVVYDLGLLPTNLDTLLTRLPVAIYDWLGVPLGNTSAPTMYYAEQLHLFLFLTLNVTVVGLAYGLWSVLRHPLRSAPRLGLFLALCAVGTFLLAFWQDSAVRYAIDIWPILVAFSAAGLGDLLGKHIAERPRARRLVTVGVLVLAGAVALTGRTGRAYLTMADLATDRPDQPVGRPRFEPVLTSTLGTKVCGPILSESTPPEPELSCESLAPVADVERDFPPLEFHGSRNNLGIYRDPEGVCRMLFFGGTCLHREPDAACDVELDLGTTERACEDIELYVDGSPVGRMVAGEASGAGTKPPALRCRGAIPITSHRTVRTYFHFLDVEIPPPSFDLRFRTPHIPFDAIRVVCAP